MKNTFRDKVLSVLDAAISGKRVVMDQDECLAAIRELEQTCAALRAKLPAGTTIAAPPCDADSLAYLNALVRHQKQLLAALAKPAPAKSGKQTLTDKVLEAKGCKTLEELVEKCRS
jgi:hypothetical protein